jgi:hypothetical protein
VPARPREGSRKPLTIQRNRYEREVSDGPSSLPGITLLNLGDVESVPVQQGKDTMSQGRKARSAPKQNARGYGKAVDSSRRQSYHKYRLDSPPSVSRDESATDTDREVSEHCERTNQVVNVSQQRQIQDIGSDRNDHIIHSDSFKLTMALQGPLDYRNSHFVEFGWELNKLIRDLGLFLRPPHVQGHCAQSSKVDDRSARTSRCQHLHASFTTPAYVSAPTNATWSLKRCVVNRTFVCWNRR